MSANIFAFIDRQLLTLLVKPIRADLRITDTQISLLTGLAFALFYALFGLPLGRWADRMDRPRQMATGMGLWSTMTIASAMAAGYGWLFVCRMGVAAGEASLSPAAISLLSQRFPKRLTAQAIGVFQSGIFIGSAMALLVGGLLLGAVDRLEGAGVGWLSYLAPWRWVFLVVGAPGLLMAAALLRVQEPRRRARTCATANASLSEASHYLWQCRAIYGWHFIAFTAITVLAYGVLAWTPTVLVRRHGASTAQAGIDLGLMLLLAGPAGVYGAAWLSDRLLSVGRADGPVLIALAATVLFAITTIAYALSPNLATALVAAAIMAFAQSLPYGVASASLALVTPGYLRGQVTALYLLISNLIGLTLGPLIVALLTDKVFRNDADVGYALAMLPLFTTPLAVVALCRCRAPFARKIQEGLS